MPNIFILILIILFLWHAGHVYQHPRQGERVQRPQELAGGQRQGHRQVHLLDRESLHQGCQHPRQNIKVSN